MTPIIAIVRYLCVSTYSPGEPTRAGLRMRRNLDLIRDLMVQMEDHPGVELREFEPTAPPDVPRDVMLAHLRLMIDAGLIHGTLVEDNVGLHDVYLFRISVEGHDFLELARNETHWRRAVTQIKTSALPATVGVVMELLKKYALAALGMAT